MIKIMFDFILKMFIGLLIFNMIVNISIHLQYLSLSNQNCKIQPTLLHSHPKEYTQGLRYYLFAINLDRYVRGCNTLNELSNKVCVPNETEDLNLSMFIIITGIN